jgi:hypothetical protein
MHEVFELFKRYQNKVGEDRMLKLVFYSDAEGHIAEEIYNSVEDTVKDVILHSFFNIEDAKEVLEEAIKNA